MPVYAFKCKSCGAEREVSKALKDYDEPEYCANRGCRDAEGNEKQMVRQIGCQGFSLKGRGWFKDGYQK